MTARDCCDIGALDLGRLERRLRATSLDESM
jgi:hypothetical protein